VGQVQDVGLIFLSAMATSIAGTCLEAGRDAATALGTSLLTMSAATFFTGAMTLLVGGWARRSKPQHSTKHSTAVGIGRVPVEVSTRLLALFCQC